MKTEYTPCLILHIRRIAFFWIDSNDKFRSVFQAESRICSYIAKLSREEVISFWIKKEPYVLV